MPRPITKTPDETIKEVIEQTALKTAKLFRDETRNNNTPAGSRISQIVKTAGGNVTNLTEDAARSAVEKEKAEREKEEKESQEKEQEEKQKIKEKVKEEKVREEKELHYDELLCPSCHKGHVHVLKGTSDGKVKCTGPECGTIYNLIPDDSDFKCEKCGTPHKKPAESNENDKCPFCGGDRFRPYDWSKLRKSKK